MDEKKVKINTKVNPKISYSGAVKVEYYKNGKKISIKKHNSGLLPLFAGISRYLGGYDSSRYVPKKLDALYTSEIGGIIQSRSALIEPIAFNTQPLLFDMNNTQSDTQCQKVQYGFVIQRSSLIATNVEIDTLRLLSDNGDVCAYIELPIGKKISTDIASNILIYWTLIIDNAIAE